MADAPLMYELTSNWTAPSGGTTIWAGVSFKGPFIETDDTISLPGSELFVNIPKSILKLHEPKLPATKSRTKKT
jgi:hypothetical protein